MLYTSKQAYNTLSNKELVDYAQKIFPASVMGESTKERARCVLEECFQNLPSGVLGISERSITQTANHNMHRGERGKKNKARAGVTVGLA